MDRIRQILYEGAIIVLFGVTAAIVITLATHYFRGPSLEEFGFDYVGAESRTEQVMIAEKAMSIFPVEDLLSTIEKTSADAGRVCHVQGHSIGKAIYKKESNFTEAVRQCGGTCTHGCFHGVMMQMFSTDSDTLGGVIEEESTAEYLIHVQKVAQDLCTRPDVESVVHTRYCYHGLGHVFAYLSGNDLDATIRSCDTLRTAYGRGNCATGGFMEYLMSTSSVAVQNTKDDDVCDIHPQYRKACYRYKAYGWMKAWGGYEPALRGCDQFGEHRLQCIRSTAQAQAAAVIVESADNIRKLCQSLAGEGRIACIEGALLRVTELNNGDDSDEACANVEEPYHKYCLNYIRAFRDVESKEV